MLFQGGFDCCRKHLDIKAHAVVRIDIFEQDFAYRVNLSWGIFVLAGVLALAIALLTVSWQAIRAATANLVDALRYE